MTFRAISYGGGVQSTAMGVLRVQGRIAADVMLFANVGDHAEHPDSLRYVRDVFTPWAAKRGLVVHELQRKPTSTNQPDLHDTMTEYGGNRVKEPIPLRNGRTGAPTKRNCTADWKVKVVQTWMRDNGHVPGTSLIGISVDEIERASGYDTDPDFPRAYPLLDLGLNRADCESIIRDAGLPVPRKSSCYFCPFHKPQVWAEMRRDEPDLFERSQRLEDHLNAQRARVDCPGVGKPPRPGGTCQSCREPHDVVDGVVDKHVYPPAYLTRFGKRLSDAIPVAQVSLFGAVWAGTDIGEAGCDEGVCFV